jgi:hypothetical protein
MSVDDHGLEAIRKSAIEIIPGDKAEYLLRTKILNLPGESVPVTLISDNTINSFGSISGLGSSSLTEVHSFTVPSGKNFYLKLVDVGGSNVAKYFIEVDSSTEALARTYWGEFSKPVYFFGAKLTEGTVLKVSVIHERPTSGDFEARIVGDLV